MTQMITCGCGFEVYPGLDCMFCDATADDLLATADPVAQLTALASR